MNPRSYILVLAVAALLTVGTGCSEKIEIPEDQPKQEPTSAPEPKPELKPMTPEFDPTAGFSGPGIEEKLLRMRVHPDNYYTYYSICNASSHDIFCYFGIAPRSVSLILSPGEKDIVGILEGTGFGFIGRLCNLQDIASIQCLYDGATRTRNGSIYDDEITDFTIQSDASHPGDVSKWYYEEYNPNLCRWTYIITDQDYERAKLATKNRTYDIWWSFYDPI